MSLLIHVNPAFLESFFPPVLSTDTFMCGEGIWECVRRPGKAGNNIGIDFGIEEEGSAARSQARGAARSSAARGEAMPSAGERRGDASRAESGLFGEQDGQKSSGSRFATSQRLEICVQSLMRAASAGGGKEEW